MTAPDPASPDRSMLSCVPIRRITVLLGIPIDRLSMGETLDRLTNLVHIGRSTHRSHYAVTVNTDFVVTAHRDPHLRRILQQAHLATADGMPLLWSARLLHNPLPERVAGADLVPTLAQRAAQEGFSIYLLGAAPGVAARAAQLLRARNPHLKIAGIASPDIPNTLETPPEVLEDIRRARPDILLVAFGNPKQEKWIDLYAPQLSVPVIMGVGGTFDFIAGRTTRAPRWMQQIGLEWFYRLIREPGRLWKRYATDLLFFTPLLVRQLIAMRPPDPIIYPSTELILLNQTSIIHLNGQLTINNTDTFRRWSQVALDASPYLIINLADLDFLDSSAIGTLVALHHQAHQLGGQLWLAGLKPTIHDTLRLLKLDTFFQVRENIDACLDARGAQLHFQSSVPSSNGRHHDNLPASSPHRPDLSSTTSKTAS